MRASLLLLLVAALVSGCAHSRSAEEQASTMVLPEVPAFLSGPMGVLLTNAGGYSAYATSSTGSASNDRSLELVSGQLFGRGDMLLYAPDPKFQEKRLRPVGLSYIWNVKENRGYVLSETLQGWAPIGFGVHYTNLVSTRTELLPERVEGHPCIQEMVSIAATEGLPAQFQVWRATDLKSFPMRISGGPKAVPQTLTLSKVRLEPPAADLFAPPESFTHFENPDIMMGELTLRQHNLKTHPTEEWNEKELSPNNTYPQAR